MTLVTQSYLWSENIKWKVPEIDNFLILNCIPFSVTWWNPELPYFAWPGMWTIPLSSISRLYMLPTHFSLNNHLEDQISCQIIEVFMFKQPLFHSIMASKLKNSDAGDSNMLKRSHKVYVCIGKYIVYMQFSTICGFRHLLGVLEHTETYPMDIEGLLYY